MCASFMSVMFISKTTEAYTKYELKYQLSSSVLYGGDMLFSTIKKGASLEKGLSLTHFSIFGNWPGA